MKQSTEDIFHSIFYKYYPGLLFYATRLLGDEDAEDVVQDVLVELRASCAFNHWLGTIASKRIKQTKCTFGLSSN